MDRGEPSFRRRWMSSDIVDKILGQVTARLRPGVYERLISVREPDTYTIPSDGAPSLLRQGHVLKYLKDIRRTLSYSIELLLSRFPTALANSGTVGQRGSG